MNTLTRLLSSAMLAPAAAIAAPVGPPPAVVDRAGSTPDFCQTDPAGKFPAGGGYFCGPVAAANSLMHFAAIGFPLAQERDEIQVRRERRHHRCRSVTANRVTRFFPKMIMTTKTQSPGRIH